MRIDISSLGQKDFNKHAPKILEKPGANIDFTFRQSDFLKWILLVILQQHSELELFEISPSWNYMLILF